MSETTVPQTDAGWRQWTITLHLLKALARMLVVVRNIGQFGLRVLRISAGHVGSAVTRTVSAIASIRLPVSRAEHDRVLAQLERFEVQAIASVRTIECREKRTRSLLALARTAYEIGRDNRAFLTATLEELQTEHYWLRKQPRIFAAAQLACAVAGLAARSGHTVIGRDAYLCGQTYNGKVVGVDKKIGMACAFADVANLLEANYDRVAWLSTAMELAVGIPEQIERAGAVNFVARKMVVDRIAPCDSPVMDKRFVVDVSAMEKYVPPVKAATSARPGEYEEFNLGM